MAVGYSIVKLKNRSEMSVRLDCNTDIGMKTSGYRTHLDFATRKQRSRSICNMAQQAFVKQQGGIDMIQLIIE